MGMRLPFATGTGHWREVRPGHPLQAFLPLSTKTPYCFRLGEMAKDSNMSETRIDLYDIAG